MRAASRAAPRTARRPCAASTTSTPCAAERLGQLQRVGPDTADGVGVMSTRSRRLGSHRFELHQRQRTLFLNIAELVEAAQVVVVRALPGAIVGRAPAARVVGRAGIGKQRHGLVGPDAVLDADARATLPLPPDRRRCESSRFACTNGTRCLA